MNWFLFILLWLLILKISKADTVLNNFSLENAQLRLNNSQLSIENLGLQKENTQLKAELSYLRAQRELILNNSNCSEIAEQINYILDGLRALTTDVEPLKALITGKIRLSEAVQEFAVHNSVSELPKSCAEAAKGKPDIYNIQLPDTTYIQVACTDDNWLIIQRRINGQVDFYRSWTEYKLGFGNLAHEFFIGLESLHQLTSNEAFELLITMKDSKNIEKSASYNLFEIDDEASGYRIKELGDYEGNAGDSLRPHKLQKFTTFDQDNDKSETHNCAIKYKGAWWYENCYNSNLNGLYDPDKAYLEWLPFSGGNESLKEVVMMIRPKSATSKYYNKKSLFLI